MTDEELDILNKLKEEYKIEELVRFDETNIDQRLEENVFQSIKFKEMYYKELATLEELERKYEALQGTRYKYYRFEDNHQWQKPEIEKYCLPSDPKIIKMKRIISKQKVKVRFFEIAYKAMEQVGWRMKTYSDRERFGI